MDAALVAITLNMLAIPGPNLNTVQMAAGL
jgi:hypothetical protein